MTNLTSQRRLASQILKVGQNRVWIDPERMDDVEAAITREEVKKLIHEKIIVSLPEKGVSRARAKTVHEKKREGGARVKAAILALDKQQSRRKRLGCSKFDRLERSFVS